MNVQRLQKFLARNTTMDELVGARADLRALATNYDELTMEIPEWITDKIAEVEVEIDSQTRAARVAELRKLKARRSAVATPEEKRSDLDRQIAALEGKVGGTPSK